MLIGGDFLAVLEGETVITFAHSKLKIVYLKPVFCKPVCQNGNMQSNVVKFEVLMALLLSIWAYWDVTLSQGVLLPDSLMHYIVTP